MTETRIVDAHRYPEVGVPLFWPLGLPMAGFALAERTAAFFAEVQKTQVQRAAPDWSTPNRKLIELHTLAGRIARRGAAIA